MNISKKQAYAVIVIDSKGKWYVSGAHNSTIEDEIDYLTGIPEDPFIRVYVGKFSIDVPREPLKDKK